jgi:hypothetical protein
LHQPVRVAHSADRGRHLRPDTLKQIVQHEKPMFDETKAATALRPRTIKRCVLRRHRP